MRDKKSIPDRTGEARGVSQFRTCESDRRRAASGSERGRFRTAAGGFTLVELMVVLFILAILVSLAVGVGMYVMDKNNEELTKTIQTTVWGAVQAYYDYGSPKAWAADRTGATYDPNASTTALMKFLTGTQYTSLRDTPPVQQAIARLKNLPKDAYATTLNDGWGRPMRYYQDKGMGGRPVLISAGSDGDFGDADSAKQKDNVISDGQ